ncbi:MAG TPA: GatB/YqeY domain-containing protein [Mariniphaga sp.]|nr:GatB/YqeY domain-containing protein [Mariniphaga sp.]
MKLSEKIDEGIKAAMKARDKETLEALRNIKKSMIEARASKGAGSDLSDEEVLKIVSKLSKQGKDSAAIFKEQGREDLYLQEMAQVKIYEQFLPEKLSQEELEKAVADLIATTGATSMKDMGKVMGVASKELAGKAEGGAIAATVKKLLS